MSRCHSMKTWTLTGAVAPPAAADGWGAAVSWVKQYAGELGLLSAAIFFTTLVALPLVVRRLPRDYFIRDRRKPLRRQSGHPLVWGAFVLLKNLLGLTFTIVGVAMLVLPGQGVLTILLGLGLTNFPGKYALERRIVARPAVRWALDRIRQTARRPPFHWAKPGDHAS